MVVKATDRRLRCDAAYVLDGTMERLCQETAQLTSFLRTASLSRRGRTTGQSVSNAYGIGSRLPMTTGLRVFSEFDSEMQWFESSRPNQADGSLTRQRSGASPSLLSLQVAARGDSLAPR
jgi:hypothetical protein